MPTPQELLSDPFIQNLAQIRGMIESLMSIYVSQGVQQVLPFTNTPIVAALNSSSQGANALNASMQAGLAQIQQAVAAVVLPVVIVKGGGGPVSGGIGGVVG